MRFVVVLALFSIPLVAAATASERQPLEISFGAVGTADFMGSNRMFDPQFVPPIAVFVVAPNSDACLFDLHGAYESYIDSSGHQSKLRSMHEPIEGTPCERTHLFPALQKWQFKPATYDGKPTAVHLRYWLNSGVVQAGP